jgi:hypothetical protein
MPTKWFRYKLSETVTKKINYLDFCHKEMKVNKSIDDKLFSFNYFSKTPHSIEYNFFKKKLKNRCISIGSGKGHLEYHLSQKKINILATEINNNFIKYNQKIKFIKLNIITDNKKISSLGKFDNIIISNLELLFNNQSLQILLKNIKKISHKQTNIFFCFRSRYSTLSNIIYNYICPLEIFLLKIFYFLFKKKKYFFSKHQIGYRRTVKEFEYYLKKNFKIISIYKDLFTLEYNRSILIRFFNLAPLLSIMLLKQHPSLFIYQLKINT